MVQATAQTRSTTIQNGSIFEKSGQDSVKSPQELTMLDLFPTLVVPESLMHEIEVLTLDDVPENLLKDVVLAHIEGQANLLSEALLYESQTYRPSSGHPISLSDLDKRINFAKLARANEDVEAKNPDHDYVSTKWLMRPLFTTVIKKFAPESLFKCDGYALSEGLIMFIAKYNMACSTIALLYTGKTGNFVDKREAIRKELMQLRRNY